MRKNNLTQKGDTIVEVLIAIAVVSTVLAATYSIMNRNLATLRDNQERSEATRIAQGQLEAVKAMWASPSLKPQLDSQGTAGFCVSGSAINDLQGSVPEADATSDNFSDYAASGCTVSGIYNVAVQRDSSQDNKYRTYVRWDSLGDGRSEISMVYRLQE